jgi:hypothetical protein
MGCEKYKRDRQRQDFGGKSALPETQTRKKQYLGNLSLNGLS